MLGFTVQIYVLELCTVDSSAFDLMFRHPYGADTSF